MSDHEGGLTSDEGAAWAEKWNINLRLTAKGSHAWLIERHHQVLRDVLHKIETQALTESLSIDRETLLSEGLHVKNIMTSVGGHTAHEAVLGQAPRLLFDIEEGPASDDATALSPGVGRHTARLREIAVTAMAAATAQARITRAETSQQRVDGNTQGLQVGDAVDIYRRPASKDLAGWRGPCTIVSVLNIDQGFYDVKWQGRVMTSTVADTRRHVYFQAFYNNGMLFSTASTLVCRFLDELTVGIWTLAFVQEPLGWQLTRAAQENFEVFRALLQLAHVAFGLNKCVGARVGRGGLYLSGVLGIKQALLVWWPRSHP